MSNENASIDPVELSQRLIRCPSVTPVEGGALDELQGVLEKLGFKCKRLPFSDNGTPDVDNLYARIGTSGPNFCFAGHSDVVPPGQFSEWNGDPFSGIITDGKLYGRGSSDMKSAIASFVAAAQRYIDETGNKLPFSISLLITGDEEGPAINGTIKVLKWMEENDENIDCCVVGEPTNPDFLGGMAKIGRRGSFTGWLTVYGTQGHTAYPHLADNPLSRMVKMLGPLSEEKLDEGTQYFPPSTVAIAAIDTGNTASNVIPNQATATFNIRFNDSKTGQEIEDWLRRIFNKVGGEFDLKTACSSDAFITEPGPLTEDLLASVKEVTGVFPELSTTGGTSDARFIRKYCPVIEFGGVGKTMHKINEHVEVEDIKILSNIYYVLLKRFFARTVV
ncbi:MAG: succinyl-diaminopimelate desuccinylase [Alphaproteobacteria bacterium]|nr:succinyl-diaminopimelate desuccinylase [Alphaproteobacteria bacterium]MDG1886390.1 succinyl-diaminopimelate desuccinylase [Alphaproteobacteria bacterium]|tara:strand:+ start:368 stop:1540 length:1173 start_codon:yes stop_codon:yes gene_type:complete